MKAKPIAIACMVLLVALGFGSFVSFDIASAQVPEETVTYEYYVVAGYNMTPTPPDPAPSPSGFQFTVDPQVYNFGNITYWGGVEPGYSTAYRIRHLVVLMRRWTSQTCLATT
jgi:hypothetical protein